MRESDVIENNIQKMVDSELGMFMGIAGCGCLATEGIRAGLQKSAVRCGRSLVGNYCKWNSALRIGC